MNRVLLCAIVLLSGCASTDYVKSGVDAEQASRDRADCDLRTSAALAESLNFAMITTGKSRLMEGCMSARGYESSARR